MSKETRSQRQQQAEVPEGFRRSGTAAAVGWFDHNLVGNVLKGTLLGVYERPDELRREQGGTSKFFQVQVDTECQVRAERGEDAKMVMANPGDVVNVNWGPKTRPWEDYASDLKRGAVVEVYGIIRGDKVKLSKGRKMHNFDCFDRVVRQPQAPVEGEPDFEDGEEATA
jgi:hypothetical protein